MAETDPVFKTLTEEEMKNFVPMTNEEIDALLEEGRLAKEAAMNSQGSFRVPGIYFR